MRAVVGQDSTGELSWPLVDRRQSQVDPPTGFERRQGVDQGHIDKLSSANQILLALQKIAITLPSSFDLEKVLDQGVSQVQDLINADIVTILLTDADATNLSIVRGRGSARSLSLKIDQLPEHIFAALSVHRTISVQLTQDQQGFASEAMTGAYCVLRSRGLVVGLIAAEWRTKQNIEQAVQILTGIADALGVAVDNSRIFRDIRRHSANEERLRIARDLHDRTGSTLAFIGIEIDRLLRLQQDQTTIDDLGIIRGHISKTITEVREMLFDLRSGHDEQSSLADTVENFANRVADRSKISVRREISFPTITDPYRLSEIWEMFKEAILNAEKHSQCSEILIKSSVVGDLWVTSISDNGIGLHATNARDDSYGITGIIERAESMGAKIEISSPFPNSDYGTEILFSIPLIHIKNGGAEVSS
jgi:signal transduction histidine kinase